MMQSRAVSRMALLRASLARNSCSARRCSVTSRKISTTPISLPAASRIGAAESSMGRSVPSLAIRTVWFARPTMTPSRSTLSTGFSTGCRVCSLRMANTVSSGCPSASSCVQPVSSCGDAVEERDPPLRVGGDHRIADAGERHPQPLLLLVQPLLGGLPLDPHGDLVGHRRHRLQGRLRERLAGEHRHHAHEPVVHDERVSGEGDHALPLRPLLVADTGIAHDGVGQVRLPLLGDQADLVLADRNPAVRAVQVRVHPGAGPQFENVVGLRSASRCGRRPRPDASTSASAQRLEHRPQAVPLDERLADRRIQGEEPHSLVQRRLGSLPFCDVPKDQHAAEDVALLVPDRGGAVVNRALRPVLRDQDGVVRQPDDLAVPQRPQGRVLDRLAGVLVDDAEHVFQRSSGGFLRLPADQLLGDRVEEIDPALGVGADDGIADARQRDVQPLPLLW